MSLCGECFLVLSIKDIFAMLGARCLIAASEPRSESIYYLLQGSHAFN